MARPSDSSSKMKSDEQTVDTYGTVSSRIFQLKKQIQADRFSSIKEKLLKNEKSLEINTRKHLQLATSRNEICLTERNGPRNVLLFRCQSPLSKLSGYAEGSGEKDNANGQEVFAATVIKLPYVEKIPPYTTWMFLDKNQKMLEDQSVVGRRRIYYDNDGGETLICSDSEEETAEPEEEKREFSEGEDQMLWKAYQEYGLTEEVLTLLSQVIKATSAEIQERCEILLDKHNDKHRKRVQGSEKIVSEMGTFLDKSLNSALDSFNTIFCRRCLVFDCRLHGCSQDLIIPSEKQPYVSGPEKNRKPCGDHCYLQAKDSVKDISETSDVKDLFRIEVEEKDGTSRSYKPSSSHIIPDERFGDDKRISDVSSEVAPVGALTGEKLLSPTPSLDNVGKRKVLKECSVTLGNSGFFPNKVESSNSKKSKKLPGQVVVSIATDDQTNSGLVSSSKTVPGTVASDDISDNVSEHESENIKRVPLSKKSSGSMREVRGALSGCQWKPMEKDLYLKGVEIFGKDSCLIARNLLPGLKTCKEVWNYMLEDGAEMPQKSMVQPNSSSEDNGKNILDNTEQEMPSRSRIIRRRGRARKLKYTWKSSGHPSFRKRIAGAKDEKCKHYTPCGCKFTCGKQCPCHQKGTCCEKYCGCSKSCKIKFRGCHCAKSQCRSRQCPCFAAGRECDPDVCRNCWVSCGDDTLGEPPARGDGYQCGNMKLLLKQQQRILLGKSDVAGWGAFIKNPVNKNDYLGEYTGELITHREADKRGKIYDRANSSFLFDLDDEVVLDAFRKGDKLKFANHSLTPNCYAKVMLVAGDYRVGIFANTRLEASEEIFYDYRYGPDQAPVWARKPEGSKRDDSSVSHGRARKHQSH